MVELRHRQFIESRLKKIVKEKGVIHIGNNLNKYISLKDAENYWRSSKQEEDKKTSSKDAVLGRIVEEIIIYLLKNSFKSIKAPFLILDKECEESKELKLKLGIKRKGIKKFKSFDSDIIIINNKTYKKSKKAFILSCKGTTRERIGQFLSHLFLMDQKVMDTKYGEGLYQVMFKKEKISIKYGFVTLDWAGHPDWAKFTPKGNLRKTLKELEGYLVVDDIELGGGIYVLNNRKNLDCIKSFDELVKSINLFLK